MNPQGLYDRYILGRPAVCLSIVGILVLAMATGIPRFHVDASGDSLLLESDESLYFYRSVRARYGSDAYLILTANADGALFSRPVLEQLRDLRASIAAIDQIDTVTSIFDVPLFESPPEPSRPLSEAGRTLLEPGTDIALAREELRSSPIFRNRLLSADGELTAMQLDLRVDPDFATLAKERAELREARLEGSLTPDERRRLERLGQEINGLRQERQAATQRAVAEVRRMMSDYEGAAELHLSGLPMINADIVSFIRDDFRVFGIALVVVLVALLALVFREVRWVVLPLGVCAATVAATVGLLGFLSWPVSVVSSNFVALLLILTLSLNIHLAVRYRELREDGADERQRSLVMATVRSKIIPAALTAISTMAAFGSLVVSSVRPVIDFGLMMVLGLCAAFVLTFVILPPALVLTGRGASPRKSRLADGITSTLAATTKRAPLTLIGAGVLAAVGSAWAISRLDTDNRFIDYFSSSTEIHQGMTVIDRRLGGTTPLEVIVDAEQPSEDPGAGDPLEGLPGSAGFAATSYWYGPERLETIRRGHLYLANLDHVGKVMSLHSSIAALRNLVPDRELDNFTLSILYERLSPAVRSALFDPYLSPDGDQVRFAARIYETRPDLDRESLLRDIRGYFERHLGIAAERVHLTGVFVLYNRVLQSLLESQIVTVSVVFVAIMLMFALVFRSVKVAAAAIVPNLLGAACVLGVMSALGVPLDIMTISIAAIAIGIGVDDTIHYVDRFRREFQESGSYAAAIDRSHRGVGRALFYTTIVIVLGFSTFAFSRFVPTVYFGLLTGLAMAIALVADLTLLPALLSRFRVFGRPQGSTGDS